MTGFLFFFGRTAQHAELPQPGIEPTPPAVEDRGLTTGPPRKSWLSCKREIWTQGAMQKENIVKTLGRERHMKAQRHKTR